MRTMVIIFEKFKLTMKKNKKKEDSDLVINLWNGIHWWCNCPRGTCTVTACSHVMMLIYLIYCLQNDIMISESKHNEKLLHSIDLGYIYKKWALKNEKSCIASCESYGYYKDTMIKCRGCHNSYHYKCLEKETGITKKDLEKQDNKLMCNIGQPCMYLRNQKFITSWLSKYGNKKDCNTENN